MFKKTIKASYLLFSSILSFLIPILMLNYKDDFFTLIILIFSIGLLIKSIVSLFISNDRKKITIELVFSLILLFIDRSVIFILAFIFGIYYFLLSIVDLINLTIYLKNNISGSLKLIVSFVFNLTFSMLLFFNYDDSFNLILLITGIYFVIVGVDFFINFLLEVIPVKFLDKFKSKIKLPVPEFLTAFIPQMLIKLVNEELAINDLDEKYNYKKKDSDLQIIIHLAKSGSAKMGHVEVAFEGYVYSYGNYDMHSRSLFDSIGDGVILIVDKDKYIDYCIEKRGRYLIEFGISLTEKQKNIVRKNIDNLINCNTIDYYSDAQLASQGKLDSDEFRDMSSEIYMYAGGKFKKIIKGKYKKFFVVRSNCAMVVNSILKSIGESVLSVNGIITPGSYYEYLNRKFRLKKSNVVSRKIYYK